MSKTWRELVDVDDAMALVHAWHADSALDVTLCAADPADGQRALEWLQVSTRSPLGAIAFHTGGVLIDGGWLRVLGAGCASLPRAIDHWNQVGADKRWEVGLLVADDAIGGFFAWLADNRTVHYLSPRHAQWEDTGLGYSAWLQWAMSDRLRSFYAELRWPTWRNEVAHLPADRTIHIYPPLWAEGLPIADRNRRAVSTQEAWMLIREMQKTLDRDA